MTDYAFYRMQNNTFWGECLAVTYKARPNEIEEDCLQAPVILLLIKTAQDIGAVHTLKDFQNADLFDEAKPILLRVSSECLLGIYGDSHCDCESQRVACLREIRHNGQGIYIHVPQEAWGNGLFYKARELHIQVSGFAPDGTFIGRRTAHEAATYLLGSDQALDKRKYTALCRIFSDTKLNRYSYELMTESPEKVRSVAAALGIKGVKDHPVKRGITVDNAGEFLSKLYHKGHNLTDHELDEIYLALFKAEKIPDRVLRLIRHLREDLVHGREFEADTDRLQLIVKVLEARGGVGADQENNLDLLKDVSSYEEFQVELEISEESARMLFADMLLRGIDSLRYEENHFYDMASFYGVPARSLKIRYAYKLSDRQNPVECKFIYKIPMNGEKRYRIRSLSIGYNEVSKLLGFVLRDCEQHVLPVFTHNVIGPDSAVTVLLKRYSHGLRTLSLMGPESGVRKIIEAVTSKVAAREINDPSNFRFLDRRLSLDFDYDLLAKEELAIYRAYSVG